MDTRVLKYFLTVAQTNNITKAAEQLHITQPTLSRQIMDLETELDIKLFNRENRRLQLTTQYIICNAHKPNPQFNSITFITLVVILVAVWRFVKT